MGRNLPWRQTEDPWQILVSEVMLQQTQASRVAEAYSRFLDRFPDPASAARADAAEMLIAWSGLGYNNRALRLREAARIIEAAGWPTTAETLRSLPGVGPYTAAAVACFAFGEQVPAVDTNLRRVLSRWVGRPLDGRDLADVAANVLATGAAADWNQAVMDLGATLCRPREPACRSCPVASWCTRPDVYAAPRTQGRFDGSIRQARGAVLRCLISHGHVHRSNLIESVPAVRVEDALKGLIRDGIVVEDADCVTLVD
ncbi:MAG TPA: A/G-specific adenine glycosylase [Actinobacteria bacterium]|nr:A/G-specific adenine glycosylase [Actinomycetota bacterium]